MENKDMESVGICTGYAHRCVVGTDGNYVDYVQVALVDYDGEIREEPRYYTPGDGERLVDTVPPVKRPYAGAAGFIAPRWDDDAGAWKETATAEEIAAWEAEHPAPVEERNELLERIAALEEELAATKILLGVDE